MVKMIMRDGLYGIHLSLSLIIRINILKLQSLDQLFQR